MPLIQSMLQCGFFNLVGATIVELVQMNMSKNGKFKISTLIKLAFFGSFIFAPFAEVYYPWLNSTFEKVFMRLLFDQTIAASLILYTFFVYNTIFDTKEISQKALNEANKNLIPTLRVNWYYWLPVQFINLYVIPTQYQLLWLNVMSIPWNTYIAYVSNLTDKKNETKTEKSKKKEN